MAPVDISLSFGIIVIPAEIPTPGGTDLCCAFMGAIPVLPIRAGILQGAYLGYAVAAYSEEGKPVKSGLGDLVVCLLTAEARRVVTCFAHKITRPAINMPLGLLGDDEEHSAFKEAYFNHYPGADVWYHADYSEPHPKYIRQADSHHSCRSRDRQ